jgi:two-component system phosphate regulon sensor histidine kinase PhoR
MPTAQRRSLLLIISIGLYIVLQSMWWAVLLVRKEIELMDARAGTIDGSPITQDQLRRWMWMIIGEGAVFLTLIGVMLWLLYRGLKRELATARLQRNFLLATGHELRTPIASLQLQLETMSRTGLSNEEHAELHHHALDDVHRLTGLAEKVLLATRLEETFIPVQPSRHPLHDLVETICKQARNSYAKDHALATDLRPVELNVDPQAFRSVLENLLENAAKYSPAGSTISVDLSVVGNNALLRVGDEGPGIAAHERHAIFGKFYRSGSEETRNAKGTGLGLYIVARLMKAMGGGVHVEPRAGGGSIFEAAFPLHP